MIKSVSRKVTKKEKYATAFVCDVCKKEYPVDDCMEIQEFHHVRFTGGYASVFGESSRVECDICQRCLKMLIGYYVRYVDEA